MSTVNLRILIGIAAISAAAACTTLPPDELEDRRFLQREYRDAFIRFRDACWQQNKRVYVVARFNHPRHGIPRLGDRYFCS